LITAVDSSVLFDIVKGAPGAQAAQVALEAACGQGSVCVCEVVVAELGRFFARPADLLAFLSDCQANYSAMSVEAAMDAARTMREYSANKGPRTRVLADFLIGAHALVQADVLLTTDAGFFRGYFKGLRVETP
jgi:predicted nucleic acid-binding protein